MLCCDSTNKESFDGLNNWMTQIEANLNKQEISIVLVCTKIDLEN